MDCRAKDVEELIPETVDEEPEEEFNPINSTQDEIAGVQDNEIAGVAEEERTTRPTRNVQQPERTTYEKFGSPATPIHNYMQQQPIEVLERKHNILTQVSPNPELDFEYTEDEDG